MEGGEIFGAPFLKKSPLFDQYWMLPLFSSLDPAICLSLWFDKMSFHCSKVNSEKIPFLITQQIFIFH